MRAAAVLLCGSLALARPGADPPIASLAVHFALERTSYAIGELIPLDLEFNGPPDPDLYFSTETYDRSGRMETETYEVLPAGGAVDPLDELFHFGGGGLGGGLRSWHPLDGTAFHLRVNLNEWIRFVRPGHYTLFVRSLRLHRYSDRPAPEVIGDPVQIDIRAAAPAWADTELARARQKLASHEPDEIQEGVAILRYLDTRDAAMQLLTSYDSLSERFHFQAFAGLLESPYRRDIVAAMEARIDSGAPLLPDYIRDAAFLRSLMDLPSGRPDPQTGVARASLESAYRARWTSAATRRPPTVDDFRSMLKSLAADYNGSAGPTLLATLAARRDLAIEALASSNPATQLTLLESRWSIVRDVPWIRDALDRLYGASKGNYRFPDVGDHALQRITELDPAAGRAMALDEIRSGAHGVTFTVLSSIDGVAPPELDGALQRRLERARGDDTALTVWLMSRYGSDALTPTIELLVSRGVACAEEAASIAFLLQHKPDAAALRLQPDFDRSRGCGGVPWDQIAAHYWDDRLESAALAHLRLEDVRRAAEAIQVLGEKGSRAVKAPLIQRLGQWEREWHGRAAELDAFRSHPVDSPDRIENAIVNALLDNRQWTLTPDDIAIIRASCVTDRCRSNLDARARMIR